MYERRINSSVEHTRSFWSEYYDREISDEMARRINARIVNVFRLLKKWRDCQSSKDECIAKGLDDV